MNLSVELFFVLAKSNLLFHSEIKEKSHNVTSKSTLKFHLKSLLLDFKHVIIKILSISVVILNISHRNLIEFPRLIETQKHRILQTSMLILTINKKIKVIFLQFKQTSNILKSKWYKLKKTPGPMIILDTKKFPSFSLCADTYAPDMIETMWNNSYQANVLFLYHLKRFFDVPIPI